jgi:N-acetylneuraminate synthase
LQVSQLKIPSGEITNAPFLLKAARTGKRIILSTGMCSLGDIEKALGVLAFGYLNQTTEPSLSSFQNCYASYEGQKCLQENCTSAALYKRIPPLPG